MLMLDGAAAWGTGNALGDLLTGRAANDALSGMGGDDRILGGLGRDVLSGGTGADVFVFNSVADSVIATVRSDRITDFSRAEGDRIRLAAIDANVTNADGTNDAVTFIGAAGFTAGVAGQLRTFFNAAAGAPVVQGDVNGDGRADFQTLPMSPTNLGPTAGDFLL